MHPYTFRSDFLPTIYSSPTEEILQFAVTIGVDGIFDDLPGFVYDVLTVRFRAHTSMHAARGSVCMLSWSK